ncbi:ATPase family AAA domain-containing protein 2-like [Cololabis saira]|uniref:ATPase family AAA domain-containing protein 2-like n=1 Tax=Cololabis saira TaxID=129043 RepID=UPI002AD54B4B|nr:ATPase family AAA domain-containing protein 2-like [Cololabis saira]
MPAALSCGEATDVCSSTVSGNSPEARQLHNRAALEPMQLECQEVPDDEPSSLTVDHNKLKDLLNSAVAKTQDCEVESVEMLYALLAQCIFRHRDNPDKTELVQEMEAQVDSFTSMLT